MKESDNLDKIWKEEKKTLELVYDDQLAKLEAHALFLHLRLL